MNLVPWVVKYRPKKVCQLVGQAKAVDMLDLFVSGFNGQRKKALLLHGPVGTGKTSLVYAYAEENNYDLVEMNASDFRNKAHIEEVLGPASQQASLFGNKKIILVDEVDGISGQKDRGAAPALVQVIKETKFPIVLTANDPYNSKLRSLRRYCNMVPLKNPSYISVTKLLKRILDAEEIEYEDAAIKKFAMFVQGDMRAAINDLQMIAAKRKKITEKDIKIWDRSQEETIFNALKLIFKSFDIEAAMRASSEVTENLDTINFWIEQNIPAEYIRPVERKRAMDWLSWSDIFQRRIMRWQHWRFLKYANIFSVAGVQQSKDDANPSYVPHNRPGILMSLYIRASKRKKMRAITEQIGPKLHASSKVLTQTFYPYYNYIQIKNPEMAEELNEYLEI